MPLSPFYFPGSSPGTKVPQKPLPKVPFGGTLRTNVGTCGVRRSYAGGRKAQMRRAFIMLGLLAVAAVVALQLAAGGTGTVQADNKPHPSPTPGGPTATPQPCQKNNPSKSCGSAVIVMSYSGTFRVPVMQTRLVLQGHASKASHGTQIFAQRVVAPRTPKHGTAFRVFAVGHLPALTLVQHGKLYAYGVGKGSWSVARTVTRSGIYAAVTR